MESKNDFWECAFLADPASELKKHETLSANNERVLVKRFELLHQVTLDLLDQSKSEKHLAECLAAVGKLRREESIGSLKVQKMEDLIIGIKEELKTMQMHITEVNNTIPIVAEELESLNQRSKDLNRDVDEARKEFEMTRWAQLKMKDEYKKNLGCHVRLIKSEEKGYVFVFSYDSTVQPANFDTMPPKSLKLYYIPKDRHWKLLETNPTLPEFDQLVKKLEESQDTRGFLASMRSAFKKKR